MNLQLLEGRVRDAAASAQKILDRYSAIAAEGGRDMNSVERQAVDAAVAVLNQEKQKLARARSDASMLSDVDQLLGGGRARSSGAGGGFRGGSIGAQFVESE